MNTVEIVNDGLEQTIHLPAGCRFDATEVFVKRVGRSVLLIPKDEDPWQMFTQSLDEFTVDFMEARHQPLAEAPRPTFE